MTMSILVYLHNYIVYCLAIARICRLQRISERPALGVLCAYAYMTYYNTVFTGHSVCISIL